MSAPAGQLYELVRYREGHSQIVGYARVSTRDQSLTAQLAQLRAAGAARVYAEKCSSVGARPGWAALTEHLRRDDTVVVVRLDRIGRHLGEVVQSCHAVHEAGAYVRALAQSIDTRSAQGRALLPIWAALAETERAILVERTREGIAAAREEGRRGGRPPKRTSAKDVLVHHLRAQKFSHGQIAKAVDLGKTTVRRILSEPLPAEDARQLRLPDGGQ